MFAIRNETSDVVVQRGVAALRYELSKKMFVFASQFLKTSPDDILVLAVMARILRATAFSLQLQQWGNYRELCQRMVSTSKGAITRATKEWLCSPQGVIFAEDFSEIF